MGGGRGGFSLIEVMVALVILGIVMMGLQAMMTDRLLRTMGAETRWSTASQLAKERLAQVQLDPGYNMLETRYGGVESPVAGAPLFTRSTTIVRSARPAEDGDYKTVTVRVWAASMEDTVAQTTIVAAP